MFKIGEFSKLAQVSIRMLRYYDELGLLTPAYIDKFTGYRLYEAGQLETIQKITLLRDIGLKADEIKELIHNWDLKSIKSVLVFHKELIIQNITKEHRKLERLQFALDEVDQNGENLTYDIKIKSVPDFTVLSLREIMPDYYGEEQLWASFDNYLNKCQYKPLMNPIYFSICHDEGVKEADVDLEVCVVIDKPIKIIDEINCRIVKGCGTMGTMMVSGSYHRLAPAYKTFAYWLESDKNYDLVEISRQVYHVGPWNEKNQDKFLTEIQMPLSPKNPA